MQGGVGVVWGGSGVGGGDWISSLSGVTQEYCVTSIFSARALSGLRYCRVLYSGVQLVPSQDHHGCTGGAVAAPTQLFPPQSGITCYQTTQQPSSIT